METAAIQAIVRANATDSPLRPRRRPRFTHTRYAVSNTGAFASHRLVTCPRSGPYAGRSRFQMGETIRLHPLTKPAAEHDASFAGGCDARADSLAQQILGPQRVSSVTKITSISRAWARARISLRLARSFFAPEAVSFQTPTTL